MKDICRQDAVVGAECRDCARCVAEQVIMIDGGLGLPLKTMKVVEKILILVRHADVVHTVLPFSFMIDGGHACESSRSSEDADARAER